MMALRPHQNVVQLLGIMSISNILQLFSFIFAYVTGVSASHGKPLCVVTALASGGSLRQLLNDKKRALSWPDVSVCYV